MKILQRIMLLLAVCLLATACSETKTIYYTYSSYGKGCDVYSSPSESASVLETLPSPSNQIEILQEQFDEKAPFTKIKTGGTVGYVKTKYVRMDYEIGHSRKSGGKTVWYRDKYTYEKANDAGSHLTGKILYFMKEITWHRFNFDENNWTTILMVFGLFALLINCLGWFDVELGSTAYWLLNIIYWICYLGILFSEFVIFCMHSPFDMTNGNGSLIDGPFIVELIVGLLAFALLVYTVGLSIAGTPNMLGSLIPQGAFGFPGYDIVIMNMIFSVLCILLLGLCIWLMPGYADYILYLWMVVQGIIFIALLVSAFIEGTILDLPTTIIYTFLFPAIIFILMTTAVNMGILIFCGAIVVALPFGALLTPSSPSPTGFVLRDSSGCVVDEIDTYGQSTNSYRSYDRTFSDGWIRRF